MADFEIDLDDGLPPAKVSSTRKAPRAERKPQRFVEPTTVTVTKVPTAIIISYAPIACLGCGSEHRNHLGIFLEQRLSNGVRILERKTLRELPAFAGLPRRVDIGPREAIPICIDCWHIQRAFEQAVAVATLASEEGGPNFGTPGSASPIAEIAHELRNLHEIQPAEEIDLDDLDLQH